MKNETVRREWILKNSAGSSAGFATRVVYDEDDAHALFHKLRNAGVTVELFVRTVRTQTETVRIS